MKKLLSILILFVVILKISAQSESFDVFTYKIPEGWSKEEKTNALILSKIDGGSWCQIILYKNTISKGNINADFDNEWKDLVEKNYAEISKPEKEKPEKADEWTVMSGSGIWKFNGNNVATILTTYSGNGACASIVCNATAKLYLVDFQNFIANVDIMKNQNNKIVLQDNSSQESTSAVKGNYKFNTTNFDDGWKSAIQEDWVEVTKGNIKVLLHYPKDGTIFPTNPENLTNTAWNILVSPRYSNLKNYKTAYIEDFNRPYFGMGNATEKKSGKNVFVLLFRRGSGWLEVVSPSSDVFAQEFGFNPETIVWGKISEYSVGYVVTNNQGVTVKSEAKIFNKLDSMFGRNKFAVSDADLNNTGEWDNRFSSNTFYADYYTGAYAGISTFTSSQWFVFKSGKNYHWELIMGNSYGGTTNIAQGKGDGTFKSLNDWQLYFTNIDGKPKTFDAYFSAIKKGRVLWLNDAKFPGSGIFTGYVKK